MSKYINIDIAAPGHDITHYLVYALHNGSIIQKVFDSEEEAITFFQEIEKMLKEAHQKSDAPIISISTG